MKRLIKRLFKWFLRLLILVVVVSIAITLPLRWINPPGSAFMLAERWSSGQAPDFVWVDYADISPHLALAVVAAEDQNFPNHHGFDLREIQMAVDTWRQGGRLRGASTISQQLSRNLYLWSGRSWLRKALEFWLTVPLEASLPKSRLLEIYLNVAEFDQGVYGAEAAARHYFNTSASDLTPQQAALLAAVLPAPKRLDAGNPDEWLLSRQRWILGQMRNLGSDWLPQPRD